VSAGGSPRRGAARAWTWWILRRVLLALVALLALSVIVFVATQALGDPARAVLGRSATPERVAALREQMNLDRPAVVQYLSWLRGVLTGDFGTSLADQASVSSLVGSRIVNSAVLVALATVVIAPVSFALALASARRRDRAVDHGIQVTLLALASVPEFVVGIILVALFATTVFQWLPSVAMVTVGSPWQQPSMMILPVATLTLAVVPYIARIMRAALVDVLESEYVEMARLKGLPEGLAVRRHGLRNALVPGIQVMALQLAWLAGGVVVVEYLFQYPGIGVALVDAVRNRDIPVVQALSLLIAAVYVVVNLLADVLTILVTPRLRTSIR
jgi:peptide/nickel transport system permease protein